MSSSPSDSSSLQDNTADAEEQPPAPVPAAPNNSATQSPATSPSERVAIDFPSAIADPDAWQANLNPADKAELAALLQNSPDPRARVRRILSIGYAAHVTGSSPYDVSHQWDGFGRSQFSTDQRGLGLMTPVKNDAEFFTGLQAKVRNEIAESDLLQTGPGSLQSMVRSAGSERRDYTQTFGEWQRQNLDADGYNPARAGEYYALGRPHYDDALQRSRRPAAAANAASVVQLSNSPGPQGMMTADGNVHPPGNGFSGTFAPTQPGFTVPGDPPTSSSAGTGNASAPHLDPVAALGLPGSSPQPDKEQIDQGTELAAPRMDDTPTTPGTLGGPMPVMPHRDDAAFEKMLASPGFGDVVKKYFPSSPPPSPPQKQGPEGTINAEGDVIAQGDGQSITFPPVPALGASNEPNARFGEPEGQVTVPAPVPRTGNPLHPLTSGDPPASGLPFLSSDPSATGDGPFMPKPFDPNHGLVQPANPTENYRALSIPTANTVNADGYPGTYPPHTIESQTKLYKRDKTTKKEIVDNKGNKIFDKYQTTAKILPGFTSSEKPGSGYADATGEIVGFVAGSQENIGPGTIKGGTPDPSKSPVQKDGPFKGYLISKTAYKNPRGSKFDQKSYVDAMEIPYVVGFPKDLGKIVLVHDLKTGQTMAAIVGDSGHKEGKESSVALLRGLGDDTVTANKSPDGERYVSRILEGSRDDKTFWNSPSALTITRMANRMGANIDFSAQQQKYDAAMRAKSTK